MPECEVCKNTVDMISTCRGCDILFCDNCGSVRERLCIDCLEYDDQED